MEKALRFALVLVWLVGCGKEEPKPTLLPQINNPGMNESEMLQRVNEARASGYRCGEEDFPPVGPLKWNDLLEKTSLGHAEDMARQNYFAHEGKDGSTPAVRADRAGYRWSRVGENIAKGQRSVAEVVQGWLKSPGHCKNIMNGDFTELGSARFETYWVQVFGTPR